MRYFAYGSNMCLERMRLRVPGASPIAVGRLIGYALKFHMKSRKDGSGKCNAFETGEATDEIWGVIYDIDPSQREALDLSEAYGLCYAHRNVRITTSNGTLTALTYGRP